MKHRHYRHAGRIRLLSLSAGCKMQVNDLGLKVSMRAALRDREQPHRHRQPEPPRPARARIEVEHAFLRIEVGHVGVAVQHRGKFGRRGIEVQGLQVVQHINVAVLDEDHLGFGQFGAGALAVHVAAHGGYRRDLGEFGEDGVLTDVAEVKDLIDAFEGRGDLGAEKSVGVADDAEFHGSFRMTDFSAVFGGAGRETRATAGREAGATTPAPAACGGRETGATRDGRRSSRIAFRFLTAWICAYGIRAIPPFRPKNGRKDGAREGSCSSCQ